MSRLVGDGGGGGVFVARAVAVGSGVFVGGPFVHVEVGGRGVGVFEAVSVGPGVTLGGGGLVVGGVFTAILGRHGFNQSLSYKFNFGGDDFNTRAGDGPALRRRWRLWQ